MYKYSNKQIKKRTNKKIEDEAADHVYDDRTQLIQNDDDELLKYLILDFSAVSYIDTPGVKALNEASFIFYTCILTYLLNKPDFRLWSISSK